MIQKTFVAVPAQLFTSNGDSEGNLTVADSTLFKVQQVVILKSNDLQPRELQVKRISGPTQIKVGKLKAPIHEGTDISDFLVADAATIQAKEQDRPAIPPDAFNRAVYDEEPTVALRTTAVDALGNKYSVKNPLPVRLSDGDINIGTVNGELEVQLSSKDGDPDAGDIHDSVRIGDEEYEAKIDSSRNLQVIIANTANDKAWDDAVVTRDPVTGYITNVEYKLNGNTVRNVPITRDAYENIVRVRKT